MTSADAAGGLPGLIAVLAAAVQGLSVRLADTWAAGALGSGARPFGRPEGQREKRGHGLAVPVLTGACAFGLCYGVARIARHAPALDRASRGALRYQHQG